jgi:hypothetical protein
MSGDNNWESSGKLNSATAPRAASCSTTHERRLSSSSLVIFILNRSISVTTELIFLFRNDWSTPSNQVLDHNLTPTFSKIYHVFGPRLSGISNPLCLESLSLLSLLSLNLVAEVTSMHAPTLSLTTITENVAGNRLSWLRM